MRFNTLENWLSWQETLSPVEIDLGLARVQQVLTQLGLSSTLNCPIITVAGTNGKGSVVAIIEAIASAAGKKVCCYTSPHLFKYNERIRIDQQSVSDNLLCESFERIDQARKLSNVKEPVALTYFEFGTLAAIDIFSRSDADLIVLEVGLGGRLDAVNVMQPSVAVVTSIGIDHIDWLGDNRESIGREKAGIFRESSPAICGDAQAPESLYQVADELGAELLCIGRDYAAHPKNDTWALTSPFGDVDKLPLPALAGDFQLGNAATALLSLQAVEYKVDATFQIDKAAIKQGLKNCHLAGRFETLKQSPLVQVDVAHNPHAAKALLSQLSADDAGVQGYGHQKSGSTNRCFAIIAMLADKDVEQVVEILAPAIDVWYCAGLPSVPRGLNSSELIKRVQSSLTNVKLCSAETVKLACEKVLDQVTEHDRVIIFGSFYTASEAIEFFQNS